MNIKNLILDRLYSKKYNKENIKESISYTPMTRDDPGGYDYDEDDISSYAEDNMIMDVPLKCLVTSIELEDTKAKELTYKDISLIHITGVSLISTEWINSNDSFDDRASISRGKELEWDGPYSVFSGELVIKYQASFNLRGMDSEVALKSDIINSLDLHKNTYKIFQNKGV